MELGEESFLSGHQNGVWVEALSWAKMGDWERADVLFWTKANAAERGLKCSTT